MTDRIMSLSLGNSDDTSAAGAAPRTARPRHVWAGLAMVLLASGCGLVSGIGESAGTGHGDATSSRRSNKGSTSPSTTPEAPDAPITIPPSEQPPGETPGAPATTIDPGDVEQGPETSRPIPPLDDLDRGAFGDAFGPSTGALDGAPTTTPETAPPTTAPPATTPSTTTPPTTPPATTPPTTTPPTTAPPTTVPPTTAVAAGGLPISALAPSVDQLLAQWNAASESIAADPDTEIQQVTFSIDTFVTTPNFSGSGFTTVGRDTTEEVFVGITTDAAGEVTGLIVGGHSENGRPLSAIAALWLSGDDEIAPLIDAYRTTVDADVDDITIPAVDGGTWSIVDLDTTIVFGKTQNSDAAFAAAAVSVLLLDVITLLPPLS